MSPQEGRGGHAGVVDTSRQTVRRLVAALTGADFTPSELRNLLDHVASVQPLIESGLSDPERLKSVRDTGLLDHPNPELDKAAALTASALGTPFAAVSLVDRDRHVMAGGYLGGRTVDRSIPLEASLCKFAVASGAPFIVDDTQRNPLVAENPLVRAGDVRSYAGIPLMDRNHNAIGALASWDDKPHRWTTGQIQVLTNLSMVVAAKIFSLRG